MQTPLIQAGRLGKLLEARGWTLATAESCTGGRIAGAITDIAGSSRWFDRGFITYSNQAKEDMLGVSPELIARHGAVSAEVAEAMALGALDRSSADLAIAVTGIAGPGGGTPEKPVGTVWFAWGSAEDRGIHCSCQQFPGERAGVRAAAVEFALRGLIRLLD